MKRSAAALLALALLAAGAATGGEAVDRRMRADAATRISVKNVKGEILIEGWDREEIHLTGEVGEGSRGLRVEEGPELVLIEVEIPRNARAVEDTVLELKVPRGASLEAEGVSAEIFVEGLSGRYLRAQTVSGDISLEAEAQILELVSVSGDVEFRGAASRTDVNTVSGDLYLDGVHGELRVVTVSGELLLKGGSLEDARFESVSGDLEIRATLAAAGDLTVESLSGDVELYLPDTVSARCTAESFSGSIRSDRGEVSKARHGPQQRLEFVTGEGRARIRIESFSGDVRIRTE